MGSSTDAHTLRFGGAANIGIAARRQFGAPITDTIGDNIPAVAILAARSAGRKHN
jgi:hypothetical protein